MELSEGRFMKRLNQWDLKLKTGINQANISLIERGYVSPTQEEKIRLAKALGVREDELTWPDAKVEALVRS